MTAGPTVTLAEAARRSTSHKPPSADGSRPTNSRKSSADGTRLSPFKGDAPSARLMAPPTVR
ncbi:MAG: hypothetical protein ACI8TP_004723 [Acidimicrobiales bacterium]|jgi:hypothetical protein